MYQENFEKVYPEYKSMENSVKKFFPKTHQEFSEP